MAVGGLKSIAELFRADYTGPRIPISDLFPGTIEVFELFLSLLVLCRIYQYLNKVRREKEQRRVARSKEVDEIRLRNRKEEYMSETLCVGCLSPATCRCANCGAVPYCSGSECRWEHWDQGHGRECPSLQGIKEFRESSFLMELQKNEECMAGNRCAYCDSSYQWPNFDTYQSNGCEAYRPQLSTLGPGTSSASEQEKYRSSETPQSTALTCNEQCIAKHPLFKFISASPDDWSTCKVVICCKEHGQEYEWISGQRQKPEREYDSEEIKKGVAGLEHFEYADHSAKPYRCAIFELGSSSSMDASDSDGKSSSSSDSDDTSFAPSGSDTDATAHGQEYEWISGQSQEPEQEYDSGKIKKGVAGLEHFEYADHAAKLYRCSIIKRGSSSPMNASDSDGRSSASSDSDDISFARSDSDSDAMSSLHGS